VYDNYKAKKSDVIVGWDSIGCTIFCGKNKIDSIYWCGTILSTADLNQLNMFTPTIIQVCIGVISGISYIMEPANKNKGLLFPCDLDTQYILSKSIGLLGKFFFTEIPVNEFDSKTIKFNINKIV
jgi:homospermidine synthase